MTGPRVASIAAVAILAPGCGGSEAAAPPATAAVEVGIPDTGPGRVLTRFVTAVQRGETSATWQLLSAATQASYGPTPAAFGETAAELQDDFEHFSPRGVLLSRSLDGGWGVAALRGLTISEDGEEPTPTAYAVALRREAGGWRVELGAVVFARLDPDPGSVTGPRPELRAEAQAGGEVDRMLMWVDENAVQARPRSSAPFTAELAGYPPRPLGRGPHYVVVFGRTAAGAGALAWPFEVD